jgi:Holliday junction resolvase RusA-like endonuclease
MKLALSWPPRELLKNANAHRMARYRAGKKYRAEAAKTAWAEGWHLLTITPPVRMTITFRPPDLRKRDLHNMPVAVAHAIDGIQDALGIDDYHFRVSWPEEFGEPIRHGQVIVELTI